MPEHDAIVVGSGPNGLAAAITLARSGAKVLLLEAKPTVGGGMRTLELTLPGFKHDMCSAIHPLAQASSFFRSLPLVDYGLDYIHPPAEIAHPLDEQDGAAGREGALLIERSIAATAANLRDPRYAWLMRPLAAGYRDLLDSFLAPYWQTVRGGLRHPALLAFFGAQALLPASTYARRLLGHDRARTAFAGCAAHSLLTLEHPASAAFGLILGLLAHAVGWGFPRGGSQSIADAMTAYARSLGVEIVTDHEVTALSELPPARAIILDITPRQLLRIAGDQLPPRYRQQLEHFRYGPGVFKCDYALSAPIPWKDARIARAATVHLGGTWHGIAASERAIWQGQIPHRPYILLAQQSLFDPTRAPAGQHTAWVYCHVPNGSTADMRAAIETEIERYAPGFRDTVLAAATHNAAQMESYSPNYIGGDVNGGVQDLRQLFTRPVPRLNPYSTPLKGVYLCSSSTPPGGGVHGMCGDYAARSALRHL